MNIESKGILKVAVKDIQSMDHETYALLRKNGFGASDSSILCGVNLYKNLEQLLTEKNTKYLTKEEKEVGDKPIVRKGYDLEPIILAKAEETLKTKISKPADMYAFKEVDGLTVNYDGVFVDEMNNYIPVEAKLVSKFGEKYYNKGVRIVEAMNVKTDMEGSSLEQHIKLKALKLGIPAYYYTQVQQEIAGLDAPYGYLAALFDDSWTFKVFYVPRDPYVIRSIYGLCKENIGKIKRD